MHVVVSSENVFVGTYVGDLLYPPDNIADISFSATCRSPGLCCKYLKHKSKVYSRSIVYTLRVLARQDGAGRCGRTVRQLTKERTAAFGVNINQLAYTALLDDQPYLAISCLTS